MKGKQFSFKNLQPGQSIRIGSIDNSVDFSKECTQVFVYSTEMMNPDFTFFAEILIHENNQPQTNSFSIPCHKENVVLKILAVTEYDIEKLVASVG